MILSHSSPELGQDRCDRLWSRSDPRSHPPVAEAVATLDVPLNIETYPTMN
ncbi:hypothetical protein [Oscillatoria sp. HE19RPO]|uniref:hypothetical protein n=1 Tax=Oscillatoria sp. HE19RPO TaxID=2954806 RepID=UPI0020C256C7|nr:hypothetical protein [Oscillatoria sp. HE19RPO]